MNAERNTLKASRHIQTMAEIESNKHEIDRRKKISKEEQNYYEKKMEKFECPFLWEMTKVKNMKTEYHLHDEEEYIPLMKLMRCIVHACIGVKRKEDPQKILSMLSDCDNIIVEIKDGTHEEISVEAVLFILKATKCFAFLRLNMETELKELLIETKSIDASEKKQTSTIKACKSIAWSNYRLCGTTEAIKCIREAIADNPNCDLWHFILGYTLRRKRRDEHMNSKPDAEETQSFQKAYDMMKNPIYGVFLAQVFREEKNVRMSKRMYERVMRESPQSDTAFLRIALGYMNLRDFETAKFCLDKVAETSGRRSMYLHYRGLYHLKQHQYREASPFLKEAIKSKNLPAEYNYMFVMQKIDRYFDLIQHLLRMLDKYKMYPKDALQPVTLQLAFTYFKKNRDSKESLRYFSKAIEVNPDAKCLKEFFPVYVGDNEEKNVYTILSRDILPRVQRYPKRLDDKTNQIAKELKRYCDKHANTEFAEISNALPKLRIKK